MSKGPGKSDENTTIIQHQGDSKEIKGRIAQVRLQKEGTDSDYHREKLEERLAKLAGGVAVINVLEERMANEKRRKIK